MTEYDNTNSGVLFKNERREKDTHPNLTGQINIDGKEYWLSAWTKEVQNGARAGQKMISIAAKPKERQQSQPPQQAAPGATDGLDDEPDIPF